MIIAPYLIINWLEKLLTDNTTFFKVREGISPFSPVGDEPEVADLHPSYIIYGYSENTNASNARVKEGSLALRVMGRNFSQVSDLINIIEAALEDDFLPMQSLAKFVDANDGYEEVGMRYIGSSYSDVGEPADSEAGRVEGYIIVEYGYVKHVEINLPLL